MTQSPSSPRLTAAKQATPPDGLRLVICPSCHTPHASLTHEALEAGDDWVCVRCRQRWDAHRLETVAAYTTWAAEHQRV